MKLSGSSNFRHVGAIERLFRSDHLGALDENDARQVQALGIRRVLDFRGVDERVSRACTLPDVTVHSLAIEPTIVQVLTDLLGAGHELSPEEVVAHMQDTYRGFVRKNTPRFAEFFGHLLASNEPTVFHCTAGKDRTGFAAALVLHALGASHEEVLRDYMLTNERLKPVKLAWLPPHAAMVLHRVQPEFLQAAYQALDEDFGGLEGYFQDGLGLREQDRATLRALYLPARL